MPYMALEKREDKGFNPELESVEEQISADGENIEIYGWVDDHRRIAVILSIDEIPEEARRRIAEKEIRKAAELLHVVRVAIEGEDETDD